MQYKYIWKVIPKTNIYELYACFSSEEFNKNIYLGYLCHTNTHGIPNKHKYMFNKLLANSIIITAKDLADAKYKAEVYVEQERYKIWDKKAEEYKTDREDRD